jgi:hypothetical protein
VPVSPSRRDRGRQHAVDDRDVGSELVEHLAGVEGDLRAGHGCHDPIRLRLEGDTHIWIVAAPVAGHLEAEPPGRGARLARGEHRDLAAPDVALATCSPTMKHDRGPRPDGDRSSERDHR